MPKDTKVSPKTSASIKFDLTIPESDIKAAYKTVLTSVQATTQIQGFRKGKAPLEVVEKNTDPGKLYEAAFEKVFPVAYAAAIKAKNLSPITTPRVTIKTAKAEGDWVLEVEIAQKPEIILNDYRSALKGLFNQKKIWTPKDKQEDDTATPDQNQKISEIFRVLLKTASVSMSPLLFEDEANRSLSKLLEQINKLGLTLEQYVGSLNRTVDDLKKEHLENAEATMKLEYILAEIAKAEKLTLSNQEYTKFLATIKNEATKKQLDSDETARESVRYTLTKKKVIDHLLTLAS